MSSSQAIVFVDLVNSTSAFEKLGNEVIATSMAKLTRWISRTSERFGGRVIKLLGDGVLGMFADPAAAARACIAIQTRHANNLDRWPEPMRMGLRMGLTLGYKFYRQHFGDNSQVEKFHRYKLKRTYQKF